VSVPQTLDSTEQVSSQTTVTARSRRPMRQVNAVVGAAAMLGVWWLVADVILAKGGAVPSPWAVLHGIYSDGWHFYEPNLEATVGEAARGYLWGNVVAIALALFVLLAPFLEPVAMQLAVVCYCMPIVAVGPILTVVFTGSTPMVALSALSVFFTTLIGCLLGLRSADHVSLDLVKAHGGGRWQQLRRVQLIAALPSLVNSLKIAAPAALLGAIIGEFLGDVNDGLGASMIIAEQQLDVARTWGIAVVAAVIAGVVYALLGLASRRLDSWVTGTSGAAR
jgi:ABC-type nitrate/sulfonate/bicarbonate transport system permease component